MVAFTEKLEADNIKTFAMGEKIPLTLEFTSENSDKIFNSGIKKQVRERQQHQRQQQQLVPGWAWTCGLCVGHCATACLPASDGGACCQDGALVPVD